MCTLSGNSIMFKSRKSVIKNPLRRISLVLVILVLFPTLFYLSSEITSLNEYEEMISEIYAQQLDAILFSVNQYVWDFINSWKMTIETTLDTRTNLSETPDFDKILVQSASLKYLVITDTSLSKSQSLDLSGNRVTIEMERFIKKLSLKKVIARLQQYRSEGYNKIESKIFQGSYQSGDEEMALTFLTRKSRVVVLFVDFPRFVEEIIVPKLEEVASDPLEIGVFTSDNHFAVYRNGKFSFEEANLSKKLWLTPEYLLAIRMKEKSPEDLAQERFINTLILIPIFVLVLVLGAWLIFRNIRNEVRLAQMKSDFVSNVSHELRTPLALMRIYTEILEQDRIQDKAKKKKYFAIINSENERLTRLINNILNFSRMESGKKVYNFELSSINLIVENTLAVYEYHLQEKGFELNVDLEKELPDVYLDEEAVAECIINILDNSVKYSETEKCIRVSTGRSKEFVYLRVEDKGIGIDSKDIEHIFDKFYRVSDSLVHNTKGSGLGLTLIRHFMDAHKGKIDVKSKIGEGTIITLLFPLSARPESQ